MSWNVPFKFFVTYVNRIIYDNHLVKAKPGQKVGTAIADNNGNPQHAEAALSVGSHANYSEKEVVGMLVLSRKTGERIHIGDDIFIEIRRVAGNRVTIALEAPKSVRILRGELKEAAEEFEEPPLEQQSPAEVPRSSNAVESVVVSHHGVEQSDSMLYSI